MKLRLLLAASAMLSVPVQAMETIEGFGSEFFWSTENLQAGTPYTVSIDLLDSVFQYGDFGIYEEFTLTWWYSDPNFPSGTDANGYFRAGGCGFGTSDIYCSGVTDFSYSPSSFSATFQYTGEWNVCDTATPVEWQTCAITPQLQSTHLSAEFASDSRYKFSIAPTVTGAIPEPSTWAMMILGFGIAGTAIRRRQRFTLPKAQELPI